MKTASVVGERGQVTIPKRLREKLAIGPGTRLHFQLRGRTLVASAEVDHTDPIAALVGILRHVDVDAAMDRLRGPRWERSLDGRRR